MLVYFSGRAVARIPRVSGGGTHRAGQAAFGNQCRSGRMFAPTKVWRKWHQKINLNQKYALILCSVTSKLMCQSQALRDCVCSCRLLCSFPPPSPRSLHIHRPRSSASYRVGCFRWSEDCQNLCSTRPSQDRWCWTRRRQGSCESQTPCRKGEASWAPSPPAPRALDRLQSRRGWKRARSCIPKHPRCGDQQCLRSELTPTRPWWTPWSLYCMDILGVRRFGHYLRLYH